MRIGQFGEAFLPIYDGVSRVIKAYADTMAARNQEVYVITPMDNSGFRGQYPFEIVDFASVKIPLKMPYRIGSAKFDPHYNKRISQIDLEICHAHGPAFAGTAAYDYARKYNVPLVGTFHTKFYDDVLEVTHSKTLAKVGAKTVANFYEKCDEVWAVSEASGQTLYEYGYKGDIVVMPNGTNIRTLNTEKIPEVVEKYKINTNKPMLVFVGQINFKKNIKRIIEASSLLKKQGMDFQLVFCGRGPDEDAVKRLIETHNLKENFIYTGHVLDIEVLDCIYSLADLLVFPSIYDNAPMVVREAACQHTPALVAKGSSASEGVIHMNNGLVAEDTTEDVARCIREYLSASKEKQSEIQENAFKTIPLSWDGPLMDTILNRYQNLIDMYKYYNTKRLH